MNKERIQYAISIMEQAKNLKMTYWQGEEGFSSTIEELHTCGNTACFAGYLALSPLFQADGGGMDTDGEPVFEGGYGHEAIHSYFEMDERFIPLIYAIVYGEAYNSDVWLESGVGEDAICGRGIRLKEQLSTLTGETYWHEWRPEHLVTILNAILNGEFDWLLED